MEKLKLSKSPLIVVLAQVKFAPVLRIESFVPDIQEELRRQGYPRFEEENSQEIKLTQGAMSPPSIRNTKRWIFSSLDKTKSVVLADSFITFATAKYDTFQSFSEEFKKLLNLVEKKADLHASERVGLRYVDLIRGSNDASSEKYLRQGMRGLDTSAFPESQLQNNSSMSVASTPYGQLLVRSVHTSDGTFIPPDLAAVGLNIQPKLSKGESITILDIDHNGEFSAEFQSQALLDRLSKLHDYTDLAFREAVTKEAIKAWT